MKKHWKKWTSRLTVMLLVMGSLSFVGQMDGWRSCATGQWDGFLETLSVADPEFTQNGGLLLTQTDAEDAAQMAEDGTDGLRQASNNLPAAYSLLDDEGVCYVTSVKDQGSTGLCWAYAALGACESNILKQGLDIPDTWLDENGELNFSEAALGWYPYTPHSLLGDLISGDHILLDGKGVSGGNASIASFSLAAGNGPQLEQYAPVEDWSQGYSEYQRYASYYRLQNVDILPMVSSASEQATVKQWLMESGGVSVSYYSKGTYYDNGTTVSYYQDTYDENSADHAVLLVGWDDNYAKENFRADAQPSSDGAWLARNSWGADDVDGGYFWISYEELSLCEFARFQMAEDIGNTACYQYDGSVSYTALRQSAVANIYTIETDCTASEVMFPQVTYNPTTSYYTVSLYRLASADTSPEDGTLLLEQSGWISYEGYKSISLETPVSLQQGERVAVVLELRSDNGRGASNLYAAFESENYDTSTGMQRSCAVQAGQTYVRSNYGDWADIMELKTLAAEDGTYPFGELGNAALKLVVENTTETQNWAQLDASMALAEQAGGTALSLESYTAAAAMRTDSTTLQPWIDNAAWNLLGALEQLGIGSYPTHVYTGLVSEAEMGDVDWDGYVDTSDAFWTLIAYSRVSAGSRSTWTMKQAAAADMDATGIIDTTDAFAILMRYAWIASGH